VGLGVVPRLRLPRVVVMAGIGRLVEDRVHQGVAPQATGGRLVPTLQQPAGDFGQGYLRIVLDQLEDLLHGFNSVPVSGRYQVQEFRLVVAIGGEVGEEAAGSVRVVLLEVLLIDLLGRPECIALMGTAGYGQGVWYGASTPLPLLGFDEFGLER